MNTDAIIESYVNDVVGRLPRRQRRDIAFELRSLLAEELQGRAADAGREADAAMAIDLLASFGRPVDVADRYRPAGFTVIRPADAPRFAWIGLGGVAVQWVLSLIATFTVQVDPALPGSDWLSRLGAWWLTWGLGSFWWPGFIVSLTVIAAAFGTLRKKSDDWTPPKATILDRDRVNRPVMVLLIALGVCGAALVLALPFMPVWGSNLPEPLLDAFVFDEGFLSWRAPWVLLLWAAILAVSVAALMAGRWSRRLHQLGLGLAVAWIALVVWWIAAGPIFVSTVTNDTTKACLVLVLAFTVFGAVLTARRIAAPITAPKSRA